MRDFLIIAGYDESHATRYTHISRHIEKMTEDATELCREGRLSEIPGVGGLIKQYLKELIETGTTSKIADFLPVTPWSVTELTAIPGIGPKTAKSWFDNFGILSLETLRKSVESGTLTGTPGMGVATLTKLRAYLAEHP